MELKSTSDNQKYPQIHQTVLPTTVSSYLDPHYWNERFKHEEHYEWLKEYSHFRHLVLKSIKPNSSLSEEIYKDQITSDITCIDLSDVAVEKRQQRLSSKGLTAIRVMVADMLDLPFGDETYDVVIEKGTMDVLFVDSGDPWNPNPKTITKVMKMLKEVHRVLKPDGIFISIAFGQPHFRRSLLDAPEFTWSMEWDTFGDGFHYFFYSLRKGKRLGIGKECSKRSDLRPSMCLYQEELEGEDYIFRTNIDDDAEIETKY